MAAIALPVLREGKVAYLLLVTLEARPLARQIPLPKLPKGWFLRVRDGAGNSLTELGAAPSDRGDFERYVAASGVSGWTVELSAPNSLGRYEVMHASILILVGLLAAAWLSVLAGLYSSRRLKQDIESLLEESARAPAANIQELVLLRSRLETSRETREAAESELRVASVAFDTQEGMVVTDANGIILRVNAAFEETTGYSAGEVVGNTPSLLKSDRHSPDFYRAMWADLKRTGRWEGEIWDRRKNGEVYPKWLVISSVRDETGTVTHYVGTHFDMSERKKAEVRITELAFFDPLTGLANRSLLVDRLRHAMAASERSDEFAALIFIDLDNFRTVNEALGRGQGDILLREAGLRLRRYLREEDTVARLGGDEFALLLEGLSPREKEAALAIETVARDVQLEIDRPYLLGESSHQVTASLGMVLFRGDGVSFDDLLKQSELAMYRAKAQGRGALCFFDPVMETAARERASLVRDLHQALEDGQFLLHYQPQIDAEGRLTGAEVLVRWLHPQRGLVSPDEFIPLAEQTGLILPLGQWVLETACCQLAAWATDPALASLRLAVNVSAKQFQQGEFVEQVRSALIHSGARSGLLELELTESALAENVETVVAKMNELRALGVSFALDDFGTGYSSLSYLKRMPLDLLKIDRSFVQDVLTDPNDAAIARTIVGLAQSLGIGVIAEGIESAAQREFLYASGCHAFQGYFFGKPMALESFVSFASGREGLGEAAPAR